MSSKKKLNSIHQANTRRPSSQSIFKNNQDKAFKLRLDLVEVDLIREILTFREMLMQQGYVSDHEDEDTKYIIATLNRINQQAERNFRLSDSQKYALFRDTQRNYQHEISHHVYNRRY